MKCTQRLYLTDNKKKLVGEGDPKATSLYAVPGDEIPESAAEQFDLVDGHLKGFDPAAAAKEADAGSDKEQKAGANKESGAGQAGSSGDKA